MPEQKKQIALQTRALEVVPNTFNEDNLTIDVCAATDAPVLVNSWDGPYNEVLSMDSSAIRMDRLSSGANVIDNHNRYGSVTQTVLGVVQRAWTQAGKLYATIKLSQREELKGFVQDVKDGIQRNISLGYRIYRMLIDESVGDIPTATATDWEPYEISFVSVPADFNAQTRNEKQDTNEVTIIKNLKTRNMPEVNEGATTNAPAATAAPAATPNPVNIEGERNAATTAAINRSTEIIGACRAAGFDLEYAETLVKDAAISADKARQMILEKLAAGQAPASRSTSATVIGDDETVKERKAVEFALMHRAAPGMYVIGDDKKPESVLAENYRGASILQVASILLNQRGIKVNGYNKQEIYERAMSTSDFPNLLSNIGHKILRAEYQAAQQTFKALAVQSNLPDFKAMNGIQFGGASDFEEVKENGEFKYGSLVETVDNWKLSTYGKIFKMSRQMIINDDLAGFTRMARLIAINAANNESTLFWNLITSSSTKTGVDGVALFHSTHGNLAASGAVLDATSLAAARTAMRRQKGLKSTEYITIIPKYIVVAPEQELAADQVLTNITPNQTGQVNPFPGSGLMKIVEPRLAATAWYVFADPSIIQGFTYGYLDGNEGIYTETRYGFEVDGVEIKARQDFAVKAWDYRGTYKNPGA